MKIDDDYLGMEFPPLKFRSKLKSFDDRERNVSVPPHEYCLDAHAHESYSKGVRDDKTTMTSDFQNHNFAEVFGVQPIYFQPCDYSGGKY